MSSSSSTAFTPLETPELRSGTWTRFGDRAVLGDAVTETALAALADSSRAAARSQGYAVGWAQGRREAAAEAAATTALREREHAVERARWEERQREAVDALTRAALELTRRIEEAEALVLGQATALARELTETLVGHELRTAVDPAADVVARVRAVQPADGTPVRVRLHPSVAGSGAVAEITGAAVTVVADSSLEPADAVVELTDSAIDLRLGSALARVREALA